MKNINYKVATAVAAFGLTLGMMTELLRADSFGSGSNTFTIDFVEIGNAGNTADTNGYGAVSYPYRMGTYEVSQDLIEKATANGMANVTAGWWSGMMPAADITWYEAAAFVNWLNTSKGHQAAYNLTYSGGWSMSLWTSEQAWQTGGENLYRHKDAYYFLPSENEWYKSAFYDPNKAGGAGYYAYATGEIVDPDHFWPTPVSWDTAPGTAVYGYTGIPEVEPADVNLAGGLSPYGTMGQSGNVWEWNESAANQPNDSPTEYRTVRGGYYGDTITTDYNLSSSFRYQFGAPSDESGTFGFRIASVNTGAATRVVLYDFYLQTANGGVSVCWQTASEDNTVGFYLFRWTDGAWVKVNDSLIPGNGEMGGSYTVVDPLANATETFRYKLVEYETDGGVQEYGPYDVSVRNSRLDNLAITDDGVVLRWLSREQDTYEVQKSLNMQNGFSTLATGLPAMPPVNVYTDQTKTVNGAFYRVRVEK